MSLTGKPSLTTATVVENDGFWPDLSIGDLMSRYRIPPEYDDNIIETGLQLGILRVNDQLQAVKWAIVQLAYADFTSYAETEFQDTIDGVIVLLMHYQHAVFSRAKAILLNQFQSVNRKANAENAVKESDDNEQFWLDESQKSVKAIFTAVLPLDDSVSGTANAHVALL